MGIAAKVALRFTSDKSIPLNDTEEFADACVALCRAEKIFDPDRGFQFSTLSYVCAQREVLKGLQERQKKRFYHVDENDYMAKEDHRTPAPEDVVDLRLQTGMMKKAIDDAGLDERQRTILILRLGHGWQLKKLGDKFSISKERVRQILAQAVTKVRETALTEDGKFIDRYSRVN